MLAAETLPSRRRDTMVDRRPDLVEALILGLGDVRGKRTARVARCEARRCDIALIEVRGLQLRDAHRLSAVGRAVLPCVIRDADESVRIVAIVVERAAE